MNLPPAIASLALYSDSGPTPGSTANPLLIGYASDPEGQTSLLIEIDLDGDDQPDAFTFTDDDGRFFFLPALTDFGQVTVQARAVEWDHAAGDYLRGPWHALTFVYEDQPTAAPVPIDVEWEQPRITGRVVDDKAIHNVVVEFDYDGNGVADAAVITDWFGRFSHVPTGIPYVESSVESRQAWNQDGLRLWASAEVARFGVRRSGYRGLNPPRSALRCRKSVS